MSRFVSGGTDEQPLERDEAWLKAQKELDAAAVARQEAGKQDGGKSLFETLQANKAAKQEAFEESTRLTNQFRSLDEDEIEFLDSVQESARAREAAVKKDTKEHLAEFRRQQEEAERAAKELEEQGADAAVPVDAGENWTAGPRKRKKVLEGFGGVKIRRTEGADGAKREEKMVGKADSKEKDSSAPTAKEERIEEAPANSASPSPPAPAPAPVAPPTIAAGLGLGAYSSDEDED
ncbi:hypothetical protein Q7P37_010485 [Cladosporium fusiforme]